MTWTASFATTPPHPFPLAASADMPKLVWGAASWLPVAATVAALLFLLVVAGYWRASGASRGLRVAAGSVKLLGILILAACLLEPLASGARARPGANQFVVLADNSRSMSLPVRPDASTSRTRGDELKSLLAPDAKWLEQLGRDFDLRQYAFDTQLRTLARATDDLTFDGDASALAAALDRLTRRFHNRPLAGVFLLTDGNPTDAQALERLLAQSQGKNSSTQPATIDIAPAAHLPPIYPVLIGRQGPARDVGVSDVAVTQTNFEDTPVNLTAQLTATGYKGQAIVAQLLDEAGKVIDQQRVTATAEQTVTSDDTAAAQPLTVRFRLKPDRPGVSFYRVRAAAEAELAQFNDPSDSSKSHEATLANNTRLVTVDRGRGPYRVLYVAGRPNWEFKFLQRACKEDDQVQLVGLIRVARREPKFNFLSKGESANPLFRGFDPDGRNKNQVEQYDQPVMVRLGTADETELRAGFPKTAEELFKYHAIVLDDIEAEFFTQDQMQLMKDFVRQRGGGLLMLGGVESFKNGKYDKTPLGDLLPVYTDGAPDLPVGESAAPDDGTHPADIRHRLALTREGWLEPSVRLRADEDAERKRLETMPAFAVLNPVRGIKPGASVLARAIPVYPPGGSNSAGDDSAAAAAAIPALVEQRFGQGRAAALLVGDLWRWGLHRPKPEENDLDKAWRQTVRWLVAEVPARVELSTQSRRGPDEPDGALTLTAVVRDPSYAPLDNATITIKVTPPDGKTVDLRAEADPKQSGRYQAVYVPRQNGAYRAQATAAAPDASDVGHAEAGWTYEPAAEEFRTLQPDARLLDRIARATGGQVVQAADLNDFAATLPTRHAEITEPYTNPLWHNSWVFLLAMLCLTAEWGLRRWKGLP
ncbi:MAG: putative rane protein [Phycisphaerales bacterium]|nr:putative rane protein [Phycisphaerales bacterium]